VVVDRCTLVGDGWLERTNSPPAVPLTIAINAPTTMYFIGSFIRFVVSIGSFGFVSSVNLPANVEVKDVTLLHDRCVNHLCGFRKE